MKIADLHCDTIGRLYETRKKKEGNWGLRDNPFHLDIRKMREGDYLLQNFAMFVSLEDTDRPFEIAMDMIDLYYRELEENQEWIAPAYSYQDLMDNQAEGKMSALLTIEEGEVLEGNLSFLRDFYRLGVRMIALTWNHVNQIGHPNMVKENGIPQFSLRNQKGLTPFGVEVVEEMERLGMLVDVSHLSDGGFFDVLHHTTKPFVASHSNTAATANVCRNLTDEMLRALGERGGVCGLNYLPDFLTTEPEGKEAEEILEVMAVHLRHMADVGGIGICALGSDYDGIPGNPALPDASTVQRLSDVLKKRGFKESEIDKIFYKNVLRVYREVFR